MNNKGQSLVVFVLLIPIIMALITLIWDIGNLSLTNSKYENEIKKTIESYLNKDIDETKVKKLLLSNIKGNISVETEENKIKVNVKYNNKSIYSKLLNDEFEINITYIGYKENNKNIIKKE